jgi:hypothetical protein
MGPKERANWRIMEAVRTKLLVLAVLLATGVAAAGCDGAPGAGPGTTTTVPAAASTTLPPAPASWPEHTSAAGGFRLRHPPGWRVTESTGSGGVALSLLPPQGDGISVLATSTEPPPPASPCRPVRVGRLEGSRCQDAEATLVTTTLEGPDRWYVLTASLEHGAAPAGAYDRVLGSFRLA